MNNNKDLIEEVALRIQRSKCIDPSFCAKGIIELVRDSEWRSVEDELPEFIDAYLTVFTNGGKWITVYHPSKKEWAHESTDNNNLKVTHWKPFPSPPNHKE